MNEFELHMEKINEYYDLAFINSGLAMENVCHFIKQIAPQYYHNGNMDEEFGDLMDIFSIIRKKCLSEHKNILKFTKTFIINEPPSNDSLIDYIIWFVRKSIFSNVYRVKNEAIDLYYYSFYNMCHDTSEKVSDLCSSNDIRCKIMTIYNGYDCYAHIDCRFYKHCFTIVEYNSKSYLIDITLSQFFDEYHNYPGLLGVPTLEGPSVGCYMMNLPGGREIGEKLFTDGYIELDDIKLKTYLDAFTLSFRNGLYYEEGGDVLPYTVEQYRRFLEGADSQVKHEKPYCLGKQRKPLKNPNFSADNLLIL